MYKQALVLILTICSLNAAAQTDTDKVKATVNQLFEGMRKGDTTLLKNAFAPNALLQTIANPKSGGTVVRTDEVAAFVKSVGQPHAEVYDERISFGQVLIDGDLASVWTPYKFYVGEKFSHCGVNSFQLVRLNGQWKIQYIIDTRRKDNCE